MDKSKAIKIAKKYIAGIKKIVLPEKAYIFGSYAYGNQREDSDIDVGIFVNKIDGEYFDILKALYKARRGIDVRIEPHLFISGTDRTGFFEEVERTGVLL